MSERGHSPSPHGAGRTVLQLHLEMLDALAPEGALGPLHVGQIPLETCAGKIETHGPHLVDQIFAIEQNRAVQPIELSKRGQGPLPRRAVKLCVEAEVEQFRKDLMFEPVHFAQAFHASVHFRKGRQPFAWHMAEYAPILGRYPDIVIPWAVGRPIGRRSSGRNASRHSWKRQRITTPGPLVGAYLADQMGQPIAQAATNQLALAGVDDRLRDFDGQRVFGKPNLVTPATLLYSLLGAERDQHANDDDRELPNDGTPAVWRVQSDQPEHRRTPGGFGTAFP